MRTLLIDLDAQRHSSCWLGIDTESLSAKLCSADVALRRRQLQQCIDAPTVAPLVARSIDAPLGTASDHPVGQPLDQHYTQLRAALARVTALLQRTPNWAQTLDIRERDKLQCDLSQLRVVFDHAVALIESRAEYDES